MPNAPTEKEYSSFQYAYDFFNARLFNHALPQVFVTLQRHAKAYGYFANDRFTARNGNDQLHEIALNPDGFNGRTDRDILSTLVHEMCHAWQQCCGKPSRRCYHDRQWATKMKEVGLHPSSTGAPGGKETGQQMTHYIITGGPFDLAHRYLESIHFHLNWQSSPDWGKEGAGKKKAASKTKYTCPECQQNAWAKPDVHLICGDCEKKMLAAGEEDEDDETD